MRTCLSLLLLASLALQTAGAQQADAAKSIQQSAPAAAAAQRPAPLTNADVLKMIEAKLAPEVVVEKVRASACDFDTSPAALQALKDAGVPDPVLVAMVKAPAAPAPRASVRVPAGTVVELETAYTINSQLVRRGDAVSFRVVNPVVVEGAVVIEKGATATAVLTKAERGGHFGRAGRVAWQMKEVTAADGTRIPLEFAGRVVGDSKGAKVATQMVVMGTLLWPIAPVVLFHGFKRGGNAIVPEGKRFDAVVAGAGSTVRAAMRQ